MEPSADKHAKADVVRRRRVLTVPLRAILGSLSG